MKIQNRTFVISGGASGLGRGTAVELIKSGANVALLDRDEESGQAAAKELGSSAKFFACDVTESDSTKAAVDGAAKWAEETKRPLGGVIPAAGISLPATIINGKGKPFNIDDFDFVLSINLRGTVDLIRHTVAHISQTEPDETGDRGVVVMIASSAAHDGQKGQVSYSASKGAIVAMTLPMARDLSRHAIRVGTISPALFETNMTKMMTDKVRKSQGFLFPDRAGKAEEFALLAKHIIENSMLNGCVIRLDGGGRPERL